MVETQEEDVFVKSSPYAMNICCPKCKSKDIVLKESKEGYFWIDVCNNCGYRGKEGDKLGCQDRNDDPVNMLNDNN